MKDCNILTDVELRAHWFQNRQKTYHIHENVFVTPSAKDFLKEHDITLKVTASPIPKTMTRTKVPMVDGKPQFIDATSGATLTEKPENLTHLYGNVLVSKKDTRIAFRGQLDSLMALIIECQIISQEKNYGTLVAELQELLFFSREILGAEVKQEKMQEIRLLGMDSKQIREVSHNVNKHFAIDHPIPDCSMGKVCAMLNRLRTKVREVELSAIHAFDLDSSNPRLDIIEALNRLSSCVYILFCKTVSGVYSEENSNEVLQ